MSHPDSETLAGIALGDDVDEGSARHVRDCDSCGRELAELTRVLGLTRGPAPTLVTPPPSVWTAVAAELGEPMPTPRRWSSWWIAAASVIGLLVGVVGDRLSIGPTTPSPQILVSRATLDTLDTKTPRGEADLLRADSTLSLRISTQPLPAGTGYLEVWLINTDLSRMVSVGVLAPAQADQTFEISQAIIDAGYVIVDISQEQFDDKPQHSGDSLVRGRLA